jgi:hypothetical protein
MHKSKKSLCVYCGSKVSSNPNFQTLAKDIGTYLGQNQIRLVYGGAKVGLMGLVADHCLAAGGEVLGIIPESFIEWEVAHDKLSELRLVRSMHERKAIMEIESNGFLAIPGGLGTLDELFEILTWKQIKLHAKPVSLINQNGFFDYLIKHLNTCSENGLLINEDLHKLEAFDSFTDWQKSFSF